MAMHTNTLHIQWNSPWNPNWINASNVLEFFTNPMNPFYDINCLNEQVRVQRLAPEVLARAQGVEYAQLHAAEPLFTIRKQYRNSPTSVVPLDDYYIIAGTAYQAPDFCSVLNSRIQSALNHISVAFEEAKSYYRFHPSKGYWWQFKGCSSLDLEPTKKQSKVADVRMSNFQKSRVESLLSDLITRFPPFFDQAEFTEVKQEADVEKDADAAASLSALGVPTSASSKSACQRWSRRAEQNAIFDAEKLRQQDLEGKVQKIKVSVKAYDAEQVTLVLNRRISTPYDCARHISEELAKSAALALVDDKLWDMHRPLVADCGVKFLFFTDENPNSVNRAYWRACSFVLGYILDTSFEEDVPVTLHSWPGSNYRTGSFVYDVKIDVDDLQLSDEDLRTISLVPLKQFQTQRLKFEPLEVSMQVAEKLFQHNEFKLQQLPSVARSSTSDGGRIRVYRFGDHIDISAGPMISHSQQLGYYEICSFFSEETSDFDRLFRFQGVSVPYTQRINSWTWEVLKQFAKRKNAMPMPSLDRYVVSTESKRAERSITTD